MRGKARGRGPRFEPRVIRVIRSLNPRSELYDRVSRVRRQDPAGILRFCPPGLAVALILAIPPRPSFSLSAHPSSTLSLAPSPSLSFTLTTVFLYFHPVHPSSSFLLPPARDAHTLGVTSRGQHVGEFKHLPSSSFLDSLRPLFKSRLGGQKKRWLKGSELLSLSGNRMIILEIWFFLLKRV